MSIKVQTVTSRRDIRQFIRLPFDVYWGGEETWDAWVPPLNLDMRHVLDRKHNPMFDHVDAEFWLASSEGRVLGRIAAFVDRDYIAYQGAETGFFGFFECHNRADVADLLLSTVGKWLAERGMKHCLGPINGSTNLQLGNQIDSFDTMPVIEMPYAPPFYAALYEGAGYVKEKDLYSYKSDTGANALSDKIYRVVKTAAKRHKFVIRPADLKNWDNEVSAVKRLWESAWADNWGFTPWHGPEFKEMAKNLKMAIIPELTYIAEIDGEPVGFCFPIPDLNFAFRRIKGKLFPTGIFRLLAAKKKADTLRVAAFGVLKEHQNKGIDAAMITMLYDDSRSYNIRHGEFSWVLEDNLPLRNFLENWGSEHYRTHRVYKKGL